MAGHFHLIVGVIDYLKFLPCNPNLSGSGLDTHQSVGVFKNPSIVLCPVTVRIGMPKATSLGSSDNSAILFLKG